MFRPHWDEMGNKNISIFKHISRLLNQRSHETLSRCFMQRRFPCFPLKYHRYEETSDRHLKSDFLKLSPPWVAREPRVFYNCHAFVSQPIWSNQSFTDW
eukprot:sb/3478688/